MLKKEPNRRPNIKQVLKHPRIEATIAKLGQSIENTSVDPTEDTAADEDRDDDDSVVEGEASTGPTRNLEFDIDPLQKLTMEEFILEMEKKCGAQAGQACQLLEQNKAICYKEEQERAKEIEQLLGNQGIQVDDFDYFINQVPSYIIMQNMKL